MTETPGSALKAGPSERRRVIFTGLLGLAAAIAAASQQPWQFAAVVGWDLGSLVLIASIWFSIGRLTAEQTRSRATRQDDSRNASRAVVVAGCVASLGGVIVGVLKARELSGTIGAVLTVLSVLAVILAWIAVHTMFVLHYAHQYYDTGGGIDFGPAGDPSFRDFAYVAFTVGMTFQVSDTAFTDRSMRWLLLRHAALSYLFGTIILGLTINVLAGLLG